MRVSPWWLVVAAIALGAVTTAIAGAIGSDDLSAVEWLGTTAGVAALVVAIGIYRLQERSGSEAHTELMEQLEAQNELLDEFGKHAADEAEAPAAQPPDVHDPLTPDQRAAIEERFGQDSIVAAIDPGSGRGNRPRLVRLRDGRLVTVYSGGRRGRTNVREVGRGEDLRQPGRGGR